MVQYGMYTESRDDISDVTELLPSGEVEVDSIKYTYSYENMVVATDRVFAFQGKEDSLPHLFQLIPNEGEKNTDYQRLLNSLNMQDSKVYEALIKTGRTIVERVESIDISKISFEDLEEKVEIDGKKYLIMYASPTVMIIGISLRENLEKRLRGRIQG